MSGPRTEGHESVKTICATFDAADYLDDDEVIAEYLSPVAEDPNPGVFLAARLIRYAAFFSKSAFHWPRLARPFMRARWEKARWAAATFSGLPDQAFCGAACRARP